MLVEKREESIRQGLPAWTREPWQGGRRGQRTALGTVQGLRVTLRKFSCPLSGHPGTAGGKEEVGSDPHFKKVPQQTFTKHLCDAPDAVSGPGHTGGGRRAGPPPAAMWTQRAGRPGGRDTARTAARQLAGGHQQAPWGTSTAE